MVKKIPVFFMMVLCALAMGAGIHCAPKGTATVQGPILLAECPALQQKTDWTLQANYLTMLIVGEQTKAITADIRIQMFPGTLTQRDTAPQDMLLLSLRNPSQIQLNQAIPIVPYEARLVAEPPQLDPNVPTASAIFSLGKTCPKMAYPANFAISGQLTLTKFALQPDAPIEGQFTLNLAPSRPSSPLAEGTIQGNFAFTFRPPLELGHEYIGFQPPSTTP